MPTTKPLAFFDIDGTLIRSSLLIELCLGLVKHGVFPPLVKEEIGPTYRAWRDRKGPYHDYIMKVVEVYYRRIAGCRVFDVEYVGKLVASEQQHEVYVFTRELIKRLRDTHTLVALTGSPDAVVNPFNEFWNFTHIVSATAEVKDGVYTGKRLVVPGADSKADLVHQCLTNLGATLEGSIGIGDSEWDTDFLELMQHPIAFNANVPLAKIACARGWPNIVERKNAIWRVNDLLNPDGNGEQAVAAILI